MVPATLPAISTLASETICTTARILGLHHVVYKPGQVASAEAVVDVDHA